MTPPPLRAEQSSPVAAIVLTVLLLLGSGIAGLFCLLVLPYASDGCGDQDTHLICSAAGQQLVALGPLAAGLLGTVIAAISCALQPPYRAVGVAFGYVIVAATFITAWSVATAV